MFELNSPFYLSALHHNSYNYKRLSVENLHKLFSGYYTESCHNTPPVSVTKEYETYKKIINARKRINVLINVSISKSVVNR